MDPRGEAVSLLSDALLCDGDREGERQRERARERETTNVDAMDPRGEMERRKLSDALLCDRDREGGREITNCRR